MSSRKYHHGDLKNALIKAGVQILSKDGLDGLSLRKVAQRAGVSHSAPYAHFPDKQSLIAAISTEGFNQLHAELVAATSVYPKNAKKQLQEGALAYLDFALKNTDTFKIMFSGILEKEHEYPALVTASRATFELVVGIVKSCQDVGLFRSFDPELMAVTVWGQVHGVVSLALEGQISHAVLGRKSISDIVLFALDQIILIWISVRLCILPCSNSVGD